MYFGDSIIQLGQNSFHAQVKRSPLKGNRQESSSSADFKSVLTETQKNEQNKSVDSAETRGNNLRKYSRKAVNQTKHANELNDSERKKLDEDDNKVLIENLYALLNELNAIKTNRDAVQSESFVDAGDINELVKALNELCTAYNSGGSDAESIASDALKEIGEALEMLQSSLKQEGSSETQSKLKDIISDVLVKAKSLVTEDSKSFDDAPIQSKPISYESQSSELITEKASQKGENDNGSYAIKTFDSEKDEGTEKSNFSRNNMDVRNVEKGSERKTIQKVLKQVVLEFNETPVNDMKVDKLQMDTEIKVSAADSSLQLNKMDVLKQIVEKAQVLVDGDKSEMSMNLKPDSLGKLTLKVVIEKGLMTAEFVAESQQVKEIIESNFNQLRDMLQQKGLDIGKFSVSVGQQGSNFGNGQSFENWRESLKTLSFSKLNSDFEEDISEINDFDQSRNYYHDGSIDYKA